MCSIIAHLHHQNQVIYSYQEYVIISPMNQMMLATANRGKISELQAMLSPLRCQSMLDLSIDSPEETGITFIENALLKARHASARANMPALADDSGLVVPVLHGAPGIFSARYAGRHANSADNINKLLEDMQSLSGEARQAYFYTMLVLVRHPEDPAPLFASGQLMGEISLAPSGDGGFGYDPVFYLPDRAMTLAQLSSDEKNKISHRSKALTLLRTQMSSCQIILNNS